MTVYGCTYYQSTLTSCTLPCKLRYLPLSSSSVGVSIRAWGVARISSKRLARLPSLVSQLGLTSPQSILVSVSGQCVLHLCSMSTICKEAKDTYPRSWHVAGGRDVCGHDPAISEAPA